MSLIMETKPIEVSKNYGRNDCAKETDPSKYGLNEYKIEMFIRYRQCNLN